MKKLKKLVGNDRLTNNNTLFRRGKKILRQAQNDRVGIFGKRRCKVAFTLAEVLITIGIIGVVAAMTIPTLLTKIQKNETVNRLKKTYSTFSQAYKSAYVDFGSITDWEYYDDNVDEVINRYFAPYMKITKTDLIIV